jgi:hypothetical protein
MNTNKAAYWIALGVLALGLNSEYKHGNFVALHRVVDRTGSLLCEISSEISSRAEQTVAAAKVLMPRDRFQAETLLASKDSAEMALHQARAAQEQARNEVRDEVRNRAEMIRDQVRDRMLVQADMIRAESDMRRAEMDRVQARAKFGLVRAMNVRGMNGRLTVVCPKTGTRILVSDTSVNDTSDSGDNVSSEVEVED